MRRWLVAVIVLCLLVTPALATGKDKPNEPKPPEVRVDPRLPERGIVWWAVDGPQRVSGPYYTLRECQQAIVRTRLRCEPFRD